VAFCPFPAGLIPQQPLLGYATLPAARAPNSILLAGAPGVDPAGLGRLAARVAPRAADVVRGLRGNMRLATDALFGLLVATPLLSCAGRAGLAEQEAGLCQLLQHGHGPSAPCCVDLTADAAGGPGLNAWRAGGFGGRLRAGLNYWSRNASHTDAAYAALLAACRAPAAGGNRSAGACNAEVRPARARPAACAKRTPPGPARPGLSLVPAAPIPSPCDALASPCSESASPD
jgi:hypothetical protein